MTGPTPLLNAAFVAMVVAFFQTVAVAAPHFMTLPFANEGINLQQGWQYMPNVGGGTQYGLDYVKGQVDNSKTWVAFTVRSVADGKAIYRPGYNNGLGNYVSVQHSVEGQTYYTFYCHLADSGISTSGRVDVKRGDPLGSTGTSGAANGVNHLHFEVHHGDESKASREDPYDIYSIRTNYPPYPDKSCGANYLWTTCPPVTPCYATDTLTIWVQFDWLGSPLGTETEPLRSLSDALCAAQSGANIIMKSGVGTGISSLDPGSKTVTLRPTGGPVTLSP